jgi:cytochrome d ubiquinol oxidase subunit I
MDNVLAARALMGMSLGFHIIYATIGIGLPLMLMLAEGISLGTGNELYHQMARRWIRPAGLLFAIGAVSGTVLSFELGLLWPRFMEFSGPLIGMPFWMEGYAFFTEAIFLALYIYGERRLSRRALFFCTLPLALSATLSAAFVISANAWMNSPAGFTVDNGILAKVSPLTAMLNPAFAHQAVHGTLAAFTATAFGMAGIYALAVLRRGATPYFSRALVLAVAVGSCSLPFMLASGDWAAGFIARHQPAKLAAAEAHFKTMAGAPLVVGGWPDPATGEVYFGFKIPRLLSLLAFRDPDAVVKGLNAFPADEVPDPRMVHPSFDLMVGSFFIMALAAIWFWWQVWRKRDVTASRGLLWMLVAASPFGLIALECGWLVTEFGRQPWIIQGVMKVAGGANPSEGLGVVLAVFLTVYVLLTGGLMKMLLQAEPPEGSSVRDGEVHHAKSE